MGGVFLELFIYIPYLYGAIGTLHQSPLSLKVDDMILYVYGLPEAALSKYFRCPTVINYHFPQKTNDINYTKPSI